MARDRAQSTYSPRSKLIVDKCDTRTRDQYADTDKPRSEEHEIARDAFSFSIQAAGKKKMPAKEQYAGQRKNKCLPPDALDFHAEIHIVMKDKKIFRRSDEIPEYRETGREKKNIGREEDPHDRVLEERSTLFRLRDIDIPASLVSFFILEHTLSSHADVLLLFREPAGTRRRPVPIQCAHAPAGR